MTIAVTGGNGEFGRAVLEHLRNRTDQSLVATVRELADVQPVAGVDYRPGNFDDPDTLRASLHGVDTVLVNATFFGTNPSLRLPRVTAAILAAAQAGVGRIVVTSWPDLDRAALPDIQDYHQIESLTQTAGPAWTILRLGYRLGDAVARDVVWGRTGGELIAPAAGARVTPAAVVDLAEATATVLSRPGHEHVVHEVTGPDALTWDDLARLAGVPFRAVTDDEYRDYLSRFGLPQAMTQQLIDMYIDFRSGWSAIPTPTLSRLIERTPVPGVEAVSRRLSRFPAG